MQARNVVSQARHHDTNEVFLELLNAPIEHSLDLPSRIASLGSLSIGTLALLCVNHGEKIDSAGKTRSVAFTWMPGIKVYTHRSPQRNLGDPLLKVELCTASSQASVPMQRLHIWRTTETGDASFFAATEDALIYQGVSLEHMKRKTQESIALNLARHAAGLLTPPPK